MAKSPPTVTVSIRVTPAEKKELKGRVQKGEKLSDSIRRQLKLERH